MNAILTPETKRTWSLLARRRQELNHTQTKAAEAVGVKQNTFSEWESGDSMPRLQFRQALADYLGISRQELAVQMDDFFSSKLS